MQTTPDFLFGLSDVLIGPFLLAAAPFAAAPFAAAVILSLPQAFLASRVQHLSGRPKAAQLWQTARNHAFRLIRGVLLRRPGEGELIEGQGLVRERLGCDGVRCAACFAPDRLPITVLHLAIDETGSHDVQGLLGAGGGYDPDEPKRPVKREQFRHVFCRRHLQDCVSDGHSDGVCGGVGAKY